VLAELGVAETTPRFEVWNKLDLLDDDTQTELTGEASRRGDVVAVSALNGEGVDDLIEKVSAKLTAGHRRYRIALPAGDGAGAAWLHAHGEVLGSVVDGDEALYDVRLSEADHDRFSRRDA
jgi:GTP-binding protein HflX